MPVAAPEQALPEADAQQLTSGLAMRAIMRPRSWLSTGPYSCLRTAPGAMEPLAVGGTGGLNANPSSPAPGAGTTADRQAAQHSITPSAMLLAGLSVGLLKKINTPAASWTCAGQLTWQCV